MSKKLKLNAESGFTKYYLMKRCLQCWFICEHERNRCPQCGYMFIGEATEEEKEVANQKLLKLKNKDKEEDENDE